MGEYDTYDHLAARLNDMESDVERWIFIKENPDLFTVFLDNDDTYAQCVGDDRDEPAMIQFTWYVGWADGVQHLMEAIGINAECV